jgi:hypothetical protein
MATIQFKTKYPLEKDCIKEYKKWTYWKEFKEWIGYRECHEAGANWDNIEDFDSREKSYEPN